MRPKKNLLLALALAALVPTPAMADEPSPEDAQELHTLHARVALVLDEEGFEAFSELFHPDYTNWSSGDTVTRRKEYLAGVERWYAEGNHAIHTQMAPVSVEVFGDIALSRYLLREDFNNGKSFVGTFASLSRRDAGRWKHYRTNFTTLYRGGTSELPPELAERVASMARHAVPGIPAAR